MTTEAAGESAPVLALHCSLGSSTQWGSLARAMPEREMIALDLLGYGDAPAGMKIATGMNYNKYFPGHQIAMPQQITDGRVTYEDKDTPTDAAHLAKDIGAKVVIPCHYDMFEFNTADPYEQFAPECEKIGQAYRVLKLGERFTYP